MKSILKSTIVKMNQLIIGLTGVIVLALVTSCQYDEVLPRVVEIPDDNLSYALDIQPFFDAKCNACHGGTIPPNLSESVSYDELVNGNYIDTANPASSSLYVSIDIGGNMEAYATPTERAILLKWIEQGALNN
jgi:hypothetical protein